MKFARAIFFFMIIFVSMNYVVLSWQIPLYESDDVISDSFDWRTRGVITPVQDYSDSPHVTAIVMVETIESLHTIVTGKLQRGSFARVVDCCVKDVTSYECIQRMGGICTYEDYPSVRGSCEANACTPFASFDKVDGFHKANDSVLTSLLLKSTLMVGIDSMERSFSNYENGIFREKNCSQTIASHALQLVGYGSTENGEPYWIARNSWGEEWGEKGYIRIHRGENICGIESVVYQPISSPTSKAINTQLSLNFYLLFVILFCLNNK